jgi:hypothetical protein
MEAFDTGISVTGMLLGTLTDWSGDDTGIVQKQNKLKRFPYL